MSPKAALRLPFFFKSLYYSLSFLPIRQHFGNNSPLNLAYRDESLMRHFVSLALKFLKRSDPFIGVALWVDMTVIQTVVHSVSL